jgi:hypothetical protein
MQTQVSTTQLTQGHDLVLSRVQVLADTRGRLLWASPALPGSTHDLTAARRHGVIPALTKFGVACYPS